MSQEYSIQVKNLSKKYRLGVIGSGMLSHDINNWWNKVIRPANKKKEKVQVEQIFFKIFGLSWRRKA